MPNGLSFLPAPPARGIYSVDPAGRPSATFRLWPRFRAYATSGSARCGEALAASLDRDAEADSRLVRAVQHDLRDEDGKATATAVRMIWTGDHLDAVRRLQPTLVQPALAAAYTGFV